MSNSVDIAKEALKALQFDQAVELGATRQAIHDVREALLELEKELLYRNLDRVSSLGYSSISSSHIFLQRMLGSLVTISCRKQEIVCNLAVANQVSWETAYELVKEEYVR